MQHSIEEIKELREWVITPEETLLIDAVIFANGSMRGAAKSLDLHHSKVQRAVSRIAKRSGLNEASSFLPSHPLGFFTTKVSTFTGEDSETGETKVKAQWVQSKPDSDLKELAIRQTFAAMAEELPKIEPRPLPLDRFYNDDLLNLFTFTDYHMGMLAWHAETGADWDLKIAEDMLYKVFEHQLSSSPPAKVALINQLGDFLHTDGLKAITPEHGHLLDADGRFPKIVASTIRVLRRIIDRALETHEQVHVIMAEGNHDMVSSIWLRAMFAALYENEPRVKVDDTPVPYYCYVHGDVLLGFHHGHLSRGPSLPGLFAAKFRKEWGVTTKSYIHTGHRHHQDTKEYPGSLVVQHATLASPDAYAARGGWMSERQAKRITYHKRFGECGSDIVTPEMVGY